MAPELAASLPAALGRRRRALFLTHAGDAGGAEFKMLEFCRHLDNGSEVMLLQPGSLEALARSRGLPVRVLPMPQGLRGFRREQGPTAGLALLPGAFGLVRDIARHARGFDAVVCMSQKAFVLASLARPAFSRPLIWCMNDLLTPEHFDPRLIRVLVALSRWSADHVVLNSGASLGAWWAAGGRADRVTVIHPGVRHDPAAVDGATVRRERQRHARDEEPLIGMFGRISRWKGQEVFLRAMALLPGVRAIIVGGALFEETDLELRLRNLAAELGISDRVAFLGHSDEVPLLMRACDAIAHCSTAPEPFGQVIVEAMLAGRPVVASDAGGAREIVLPGVTGLLTPPGDPAALAIALRRYLDEPAWAAALAAAGRQRAQACFSRQAMCEAFARVLEAA